MCTEYWLICEETILLTALMTYDVYTECTANPFLPTLI